MDLEYRSAGKIDTDRFCATFHPSDFGILNFIEQTLLPCINSPLQNEIGFRKVRAELYKLNVCDHQEERFVLKIYIYIYIIIITDSNRYIRDQMESLSATSTHPVLSLNLDLLLSASQAFTKGELSRYATVDVMWNLIGVSLAHQISSGLHSTVTANMRLLELQQAIVSH